MPPEAPESQEGLIRFLQAAGETPGVDAKRPIAWDGSDTSASLTKDILAAANSRNGGAIVIGKSENNGQFELNGLDSSQADSFDTTKVAKWVNNRCQPPVELTCYRLPYEEKEFVVIVINEFDEVPVICTKEYLSQDTKKRILNVGAIYIRTANSESAPISSPDELRKLIGLSTMKQGDMLLKNFQAVLQGQSLLPPQSSDDSYADDIEEVDGDLDSFMDKSASLGTWTLRFYPEQYINDRWETDQLLSMIQNNAIQSYGGVYPGRGREAKHINRGIVEDKYNSGGYGLLRSGLFVYRSNYPENSQRYQCSWTPPDPEIPAGQWLEYKRNIYMIINFFWFMGRMVHELSPGERLVYDILATGLHGRRMVAKSFGTFLPKVDPCVSDRFSRKCVVTVEEMRGNWESQCLDVLYDFLCLFFGRFGPTRDELKGWTEKGWRYGG